MYIAETMAEELELDLIEDENINKTEERIKNLSSKVRNTAQERDEAKRLAEEADAKALAAEKKVEFLEKFSDVASKYEGSTEYRDKVWDKVNTGYALEDAVVSVLNAEGKLPAQSAPQPIVESAGGGSASTVIPSGDRSIGDMTQEEKRQRLIEASESGELAQVIKNWGRN